MGRLRAEQPGAPGRPAPPAALLPAPASTGRTHSRGATEDEAFFVRCDDGLNTQAVLDAGRAHRRDRRRARRAARVPRPPARSATATARSSSRGRAVSSSLQPLLRSFRFQVRLLQSPPGTEGSRADAASSVGLAGQALADGAFQECSGLDVELDVQELVEGGRNDGDHQARRPGQVPAHRAEARDVLQRRRASTAISGRGSRTSPRASVPSAATTASSPS